MTGAVAMSMSDRRRIAYTVALSLHALTAATAMLVWSLDLGAPATNLAVAVAIMVTGLVSGLMLMRAGLLCSVLPFFVIGCGLFFGFGTVAAMFDPNFTARVTFTVDVQTEALPKVNSANTLIAFLIVLIAGPFFLFMNVGEKEGQGLQGILEATNKYFSVLLATSLGVLILMFVDFPGGKIVLLGSFLALAQGVPYLTAILVGASWHRLNGEFRALGLVLLLSLTFYGIVAFTKMFTAMPFILFGIGLALGGRYPKSAFLVILTVAILYIMLLSEFVGLGRLSANYDPRYNTIIDRIDVSIATIIRMATEESIYNQQMIARRFSVVPFQAYFMSLYDAGFPGESLDQMWVNIIPRIFWPDKPLFAPGQDFDLAFRWYDTGNNLAISFVGEAYWNMGWWGLLMCGTLMGIQFGWFTRQWILFTTYGSAHIGIFLMAPLLIRNAAQVEGDFVGTYFSGTIKMGIMVVVIDVTARLVKDYRRLVST